MWSAWFVWILARLLQPGPDRVKAEGTATTAHSVGFARAEATYDCGNSLRTACVAHGLGAVVEPGYADPICGVDDGLATCTVTCWSDCAAPDTD